MPSEPSSKDSRPPEVPQASGVEGLDLEKVDLSLPPGLMEVVMAQSRLQSLQSYHQASLGARAARAVGNEREGDRLAQLAAAARIAVALIDQECPRARSRMESLAARGRLLEGGEG